MASQRGVLSKIGGCSLLTLLKEEEPQVSSAKLGTAIVNYLKADCVSMRGLAAFHL